MAKHKTETAQERFKARRQREEEEKDALLPPGLINHGNTCFMNSVMQGLIATRLLADLVAFRPISTSIQHHSTALIASRRSPQLTNGHNLAGPFEQKWVDTMPIGDSFLTVVYQAWNMQRNRQRDNLSPKLILGALGQKYDQYLDFAQQDAHEFLRILLDAMRMEEQDIIKKRQPPPSDKKRRRTTITPSSHPLPNPTTPEIPEEERLMSFVDMIFGGKLTSILVCQKCKNVSQTYEDFNDISLSIKPEDYTQEKKRDRLKNFAKRLTSFPVSTLTVGTEVRRSVSVPPAPRERESRQYGNQLESPIMDEPRRRSMDIVKVEQDVDSDKSASKEEIATSESDGLPDEKRVEFVSNPLGEDRKEKRERKSKDDDGWTRLGRRISIMAKGPKQKQSKRSSREISNVEENGKRNADATPPAEMTLSRASTSDALRAPTPEIRLSRPTTPLKRGSVYEFRPIDQHSRPVSREPSPPSRSESPLPRFPHIQRSKSPKPPKPPAAEADYLRHILADTIPSSSSNPFAIFKPLNQSSSGRASPSAQSMFLSMGQLTGMEECLRLFTAVEVLDGENMVGCRRCWKMANGLYSSQSVHDEDDANDSDSVDHGTSRDDQKPDESPHPRPSAPGVKLPTSMSTPTIPFFSHPNVSTSPSISSLPPDPTSASESHLGLRKTPDLLREHSPLKIHVLTPGGVPIPVISTTAPSPVAPTLLRSMTDPIVPETNMVGIARQLSQAPTDILQPSISPEPRTDSLPSHSTPRLSQVASHLQTTSIQSRENNLAPSANGHKLEPDSTDESSGGESEVSADGTTGHSEVSSSADHRAREPKAPPKASTSRPKPVMMQPAYKRYLIATPPPVLVIHLKRFQQLSKTHMLSFSHGFKKLEDYVTFPEHLDLTPFLAPKKEDFGLGRRGKLHARVRGKGNDKCMYRLYAVVVHIGNMLGGHYVAYTALPSPDPPKPSVSSRPSTSSSITTSSMRTADSDSSKRTTSAPRQWAYISDTVVRLTTLDEVLKAKAYICMYERV